MFKYFDARSWKIKAWKFWLGTVSIGSLILSVSLHLGRHFYGTIYIFAVAVIVSFGIGWVSGCFGALYRKGAILGFFFGSVVSGTICFIWCGGYIGDVENGCLGSAIGGSVGSTIGLIVGALVDDHLRFLYREHFNQTKKRLHNKDEHYKYIKHIDT